MSEQIPIKPTRAIDVAEERSKPRLLSILFCDFLSITDDNKANLLGVFDRIYVPSEKKLTPPFVLFLRSAETKDEGLKVRIFTPDGSPAVAIDFADVDPSHFTSNLPAQVQSRLKLQFQATTEGVYWFAVFYKDEYLGGAGLVVEFRETEEGQGGTDTYV